MPLSTKGSPVLMTGLPGEASDSCSVVVAFVAPVDDVGVERLGRRSASGPLTRVSTGLVLLFEGR